MANERKFIAEDQFGNPLIEINEDSEKIYFRNPDGDLKLLIDGMTSQMRSDTGGSISMITSDQSSHASLDGSNGVLSLKSGGRAVVELYEENSYVNVRLGTDRGVTIEDQFGNRRLRITVDGNVFIFDDKNSVKVEIDSSTGNITTKGKIVADVVEAKAFNVN